MKYLAEHWEAIAQSNNRSEFAELSLTLHAFAPAERGILLAAISALTPVIVKLGGQKAIRETVQAIVDTARWWP